MVFSSPDFLFVFLPGCLAAYYLTLAIPAIRSWCNTVLLLFSLLFYFWGGGVLTLQLLEVMAVNYALGLLIERIRRNKGPVGRTLALGVFFNLSILSYFKYSNFFVDQLNLLRKTVGAEPILWPAVILPIGISFCIFHSISYIVDVAYGEAPVVRSPARFALYLTVFPQLIAGPIIRYRLLAHLLSDRTHTLPDFAAGAARFVHGLFKKVVVADTMGPVANAAFAGQENLSMAHAWLGLLAYTLQIYFDFSGYSDMALGLGRMFGFKFPENFDRPYSALSVTDFWRRWHITLSDFFRLYVYIPLGGSKGRNSQTYANLILVFLLTGLWHGANWTFIVWGLYHGLLLLLERITGWRVLHQPTSPFKGGLHRALTSLLVAIGWVLFRSPTLSGAAAYLTAMIIPYNGSQADVLWGLLGPRFTLTLVLACLVFLMPRRWVVGRWLEQSISQPSASTRVRTGQNVYLAISLFLIGLVVSAQDYSPFLYFQF